MPNERPKPASHLLPAAAGHWATSFNVLIVDDDRDMRLYIRGCLRSLRPRLQRVLEAGDGIDALPLARSGLVHLVITDVVLPRLDGYGLCRAIKDDARLRGLPVLLVSGVADVPPPDVRADGFLAKPFNARQLSDAVAALMRASA